MINIQEIYTRFGIQNSAPPHCFELENVAEMFIPKEQGNHADTIHLIPLRDGLSPAKMESFLHAALALKPRNQTTNIFISYNKDNKQSFHILSASAEDETQTALNLLQFFIDEIGAA